MEHFTDFISHSKYEKALSVNTIKSYEADLKLFFEFIEEKNIELQAVKTREIRSFITYLGEKRKNKQSSIHRRICSLKAFFGFLYDEKFLLENPTKRISYPKRKKSLPKFLSLEEMKKLLDLDKPLQHQAILDFLYATGCRLSEVINVKLTDIDLEKLTVMIREGKGGKDRSVMITRRAKDVIEEYLTRELTEEEQVEKGIESNYRSRKEKINYLKKIDRFIPAEMDHVFLGRNGGKVCPSTIQTFLKKYGKMINVHVTPHKLRHTMASHLTMAGLGIKVLQELLGHESLDTTSIYAHVTLDHIKAEYQARAPIQ